MPAPRQERAPSGTLDERTGLSGPQRTMRASIAANTRWSQEDPAENAARGQAGLMERFRREVLERDPGVTEPELSRRAECARRAHMQRLALASAKARARNAGGDADAA